MNNKIIIIGAGVAGLSAGCYARMNGYDVTIFEAGSAAGGCCTSWKRKGYTFDGCIHSLEGSSSKSSLNRIWQELKALSGTIVVNHDEFIRYRSAGKEVVFYADPQRLERHLKNISPEDARPILRRTPRGRSLLESPRSREISSRGIRRCRAAFARWTRAHRGACGSQRPTTAQRPLPTLPAGRPRFRSRVESRSKLRAFRSCPGRRRGRKARAGKRPQSAEARRCP